MTKVLVLGASGTIGHVVMNVLAEERAIDVWGTIRDPAILPRFRPEVAAKLKDRVYAECFDTITSVVAELRPAVVINCIGLVKQLAGSENPLRVLPVNSMMPHRLAGICELVGSRLIHFSTDCVFNGKKGNYVETDPMDATDLYGQSKFIGEVQYAHTLTLRTSFIGHELETSYELIEWFLKQQGQVRGFTNAIYSGLPTVVLARLVRDLILNWPHTNLSGLYHVSASPISKYDLLRLVADTYGKAIEIIPDETVRIDRSLNGTKFAAATGFVASPWPKMIDDMHVFGRTHSTGV